MINFSKKEFELLMLLKKNPFLNRNNFESDDAFDYACEMAKELLNDNVISSNEARPFTMNNTGNGAKYGLAGSFLLSTAASDAVIFENYKAYKKSCRKKSKLSLENKLKILALLVSLLAILTTVYIYHFPNQ